MTSEGDLSNFTFVNAGSNDETMGALLRITSSVDGFNIASLIVSDSDSTASSSGTVTFPGGATPISADSLFLMASFNDRSLTMSGYAIVTSNPAWTERTDTDYTAGTPVSQAIATATRSVATASGNYSIDVSADGDMLGILIAINEITNVTVTLDLATLAASPKDLSITGDANVTLDLATLAASPKDVTIATASPKFSNTGKTDSSPTITNTSKS